MIITAGFQRVYDEDVFPACATETNKMRDCSWRMLGRLGDASENLVAEAQALAPTIFPHNGCIIDRLKTDTP